MIVRVTLKDPDAFSDAIKDAVGMSRTSGLSDEEWEEVKEMRMETKLPFVSYGEYVTVEFDTEKGTATVVETK